MRPLFLRCAALAVAVVCSLCVRGQIAAAAAKPPSEYAAEPYVLEQLKRGVAMNADGTGIRTQEIVIRVQSEASLRQLSVVSVPFASASEHVEFTYVRARHPDGTVTETPLTQALEQPDPVTQQAPFYSDLKSMQIPVKNLRVGHRLEWAARIVRTKPESPGEFWGEQTFVNDGITVQDDLELSVPVGKAVQVWTNPRSKVTPVETTEGDRHIYRWSSKNLTPTVGALAEAEKERKEKTLLTPEEELDLTEGKLPDVAWSTFANWQAVGAWYRGLEDDRIVPDAAIKAKVAELTAGKSTQAEKVRAVYAYASTQIRYIGVALGIGRYQPHAASAVLDNQYGDCKDKHTLLAAMLTELGLKPDAVLIGAGVRFNKALPSPGSFNHLITRVQVDGKEVWLDSTAEIAPYQVLFPQIRDKDALAVPTAGVATVVRTPDGVPYAPYETSTVVGSLDKDLTSDSTVTFRMHDDSELVFRSVLRQISPAQYSQFVQQFMQRLGFGGTTSEPVIGTIDDTTTPMEISFHYHRVKETDWGENRITMPFMPVGLPVVDDKKPPTSSFQLGILRTDTSTVEVKLPQGWHAELPQPTHAHTAFANFDITYRLADGKLYGERKLTILKTKVPPSDWKIYKKWYDDGSVGSVPYVQLVPPRTVLLTPTPKDAPEPLVDPHATDDELLTAVRQAFLDTNLDRAKTLLDRMKAHNEKQPLLWANYGYLSFRQGDAEAAVKDYRKELELHPASYGTYSVLANTLLLMDRKAEAIQALRDWAAADTSSPEALGTLVNGLNLEHEYKEAVAAAQDGLPRLSEDARKDPTLQLYVGQAQLKGGMQGAGVVTLKTLIETSTDNNILNGAAYELADANKELPLADSTQRIVLNSLTEQTKAWTLDESESTASGTSIVLAASWDTMGWILFREGKTGEAETFLRAAWRNRPQAVAGEHLGELESSRGNHGAALADYELALATIHDVSGMGVRTAPSPLTLELKKLIEGEKQRGASSTVTDPHMAVQSIRQIKLGPSDGRSGTTQYRLLLAHGKIVRSVLVDPNAKAMANADDLLTHADFSDLFPKGSDAQIVHMGTLNCHLDTCELVLGL